MQVIQVKQIMKVIQVLEVMQAMQVMQTMQAKQAMKSNAQSTHATKYNGDINILIYSAMIYHKCSCLDIFLTVKKIICK